MPTPRKKVEKTIMSDVVAVAYFGCCREKYRGMGRVKNSAEPMRCESMFAGEGLVSSSFVGVVLCDGLPVSLWRLRMLRKDCT